MYKTLISIKIGSPDFSTLFGAHQPLPDDPLDVIQNEGVIDFYYCLIPLLSIFKTTSPKTLLPFKEQAKHREQGLDCRDCEGHF